MSRSRRIGRGITRPFRWLKDYILSSVVELKQVTWPTRSSVTQYTVLTLATIVVSLVVLTVVDYGLKQLSQNFLLR